MNHVLYRMWKRYRFYKEQSLWSIAGLVLISAGLTLFTILAATAHQTADTELANVWRTHYDILVRPTEAIPFLDVAGRRLIQPNFLSGQAGGITRAQYAAIQEIPGIEVAAPIAMVGYVPVNYLMGGEPVTVETAAPWVVYKDVRTIRIHDGWRTFSVSDTTYTVADRRDSWGMNPETGGGALIAPDGTQYPLGAEFTPQLGGGVREQIRVWGRELCMDRTGQPTSDYRFNAQFDFYLLLAGIDPAQEQALVGLAEAIDAGRYLQATDQPHLSGKGSFAYWKVPVLMNRETFRDLDIQYDTYRLTVPEEVNLPEALATEGAAYLKRLDATLLKSSTLAPNDIHAANVQMFMQQGGVIGSMGGWGGWQYLRPQPVQYTQVFSYPEFSLAYQAQPLGLSYYTPIANVPLTPAEATFRRAQAQTLSLPDAENQTQPQFALAPLGMFQLAHLDTAQLNQVPLETYTPPTAILRYNAAGDPVQPTAIYPTNNPLGYLADTPTALTTLAGAEFLAGRPDFISAIRVRVNGVDTMNEASQARIEGIAAEIRARTGLQVEITLGSSPQSVLVDIPGYRQAAALGAMEELWVRQLVGITLKRGLSRVDWLFCAALALSGGLFVFSSATVAALRRKAETALRLALGWRRRHILGDLLWEMSTLGVIAGAAALLLALGINAIFRLAIPLPRVLWIAPGAWLLYSAGSLYPIGRVLQEVVATPLRYGEIRRPLLEKRIFSTRSMWGYRLRGLTRRPARLLLSLLSLGVAVALWVFWAAISIATAHELEGSLLGRHIAVTLTPYHYGIMGIVLGLSGLTLVEINLLNLLERRAEVGLLKTLGWRTRAIARYFVGEGVALGGLAGLWGALIGGASFWAFYRVAPIEMVWAALFGCGLAILLSGGALLWAVRQTVRTAPVELLRGR